MKSTAVVVVGLSAYEAAHEDQLREVVAHAAAQLPDLAIVEAFLQIADPAVVRRLDELAGAGFNRICVIGAALGPRGYLRSSLHRVASHWLQLQSDPLQIQAASGILRNGSVSELVALIQDTLSDGRCLNGNQQALTSASWEEVPKHRHQVFVCRGPRCSAKGGDGVAVALNEALKDEGLGDDDVLLTITGCQFPCNHAPVVSVQPYDVWYGKMTPAAAQALVLEHLVNDAPPGSEGGVNAHRLPRDKGGN